MATSGTYTFNDTVLSIVSGALRKINRLGDFETLGTSDPRYLAGKAALDPIIKSYHALGMPVWAIQDYEVPMSSITTSAGVTIGLSATVNTVAPLKIYQFIRRDTSSDIDVPMELYTYDYFMSLANKEITGAPVGAFYQPRGPANTTYGVLKVWPLPDTYWTTNGKVVIRYQRPFQDAGASTDNLDFPVEWNRCMIYTLAYDLAPEYGLDINQRVGLKKDRDELLNMALGFGTEEGSLFLQPQKR